jgi:hypothetical protein
VSVAIDSWYYRSRDDDAGRFFQGFAWPAKLNGPNDSGSQSLQGHYVVTPGGTLLAAQNRRGAKALKALLTKALSKHGELGEAARRERPAGGEEDWKFARHLPEGGLVLNVHTQITGWDEARQVGLSRFDKGMMRWNRTRAGFDHMWIHPDELRALAPRNRKVGQSYRAPRALRRRIPRFHLTDNVRGEPPMFGAGQVEQADLDLRVERIEGDLVFLSATGRFKADAPGGEYPHRFAGALEGKLTWSRKAEAFTRFDLLCEGSFEGGGRWTPGWPKGPFGLAVAFEIPRSRFAIGVPPQGMRNSSGYWRP